MSAPVHIPLLYVFFQANYSLGSRNITCVQGATDSNRSEHSTTRISKAGTLDQLPSSKLLRTQKKGYVSLALVIEIVIVLAWWVFCLIRLVSSGDCMYSIQFAHN